jgi:hypothetical protein
MAFTFIVEDGTIVPNANSYVAVQTACDYLDENIHVGPQWEALTLDSQQKLLAWATRYLDHRAIWDGIPTADYLASPVACNVVSTWAAYSPLLNTTSPQALRWPRANVYDIDGRLIGMNEIPLQLIQATCEMARYLIDVDRSVERPQDGLLELKIDVVTMKFAPDYTLPNVPADISFILRGLGSISSGRTNFSKIRRV